MTTSASGRRRVFTVLRWGAGLLARTPLRRLVESERAQRLKVAAGREMSAQTVLTVVGALDAVGVRWWLAGGWGVDALAGRQTRRHGDVDVVVDRDEPNLEQRVTAALDGIGLARAAEERSIEPMPVVWVHSDGAGTTVEVLPVNLHRPPFDSPTSFDSGTISGAGVRCLSAATQRALRTGYRARDIDRVDEQVLRGLEGGST